LFDQAARIYLFSEGPITALEDVATAAAGASSSGGDASAAATDGSLGIGSLKLT
jgi:hypothetical protein